MKNASTLICRVPSLDVENIFDSSGRFSVSISFDGENIGRIACLQIVCFFFSK